MTAIVADVIWDISLGRRGKGGLSGAWVRMVIAASAEAALLDFLTCDLCKCRYGDECCQ